MKKTITLIVALLVLALFAGAASAASEYSVKSGDTLSSIAKKFKMSWKALHWENRETITNPNKIFPGQKVSIPDSMWAWEKLLGDPFQGSFSEGLDKINAFDADMNAALSQQFESGSFEEVPVSKGMKAKVTIYGKDTIRRNVLILWEGIARKYTAQVERDTEFMECSIWYPKCGNPTQFDDCTKTLKISKEEPPASVVETPEPEVRVPVAPVQLSIPKTGKILTIKQIQCRDYEINAGAGLLWGNREGMTDKWGYAEGILPWSTCYYFGQGPGFYLNGDIGSVDSGYGWSKFGLGYQHGFRYLDHTVDEEGVVHEYGLTAKLRLVWARMHGENAPYEMTQDDLLLGLYAEYVYQLNQKTLVGVTFEGWISLMSNINSTWSGDVPSNQGRASIGGFIQKQIDDDWQARVGASIFYQAWDANFGVGVFAEARYHEWLMCGVTANLLFDGGIVAGPYCRAEMGNYIRAKRDKEIISGIICVEGCDKPEGSGGEIDKKEVEAEDENQQLDKEEGSSPSSSESGYVNIENLKPAG